MYMHVNQDQTNLLVKNEITCMYPHIGLIVFVVGNQKYSVYY